MPKAATRLPTRPAATGADGRVRAAEPSTNGKVQHWGDAVQGGGRVIRGVLGALRKENAHRLFGVMAAVVGLSATLEWLVDLRYIVSGRSYTLWDSLWWAVVTVTTVGYGDVVPRTVFGRIIGMWLMLLGVVLLSMITATIASVMVERRIREERGLESVTLKGHTVLCGWNENAEEIVSGFLKLGEGNAQLVLVNEMEEDVIGAIRFRYKDLADVRFVRGDFTSESVLKMAAVEDAASCIVLSDSTPGGLTKSDERVVLAVLAIKSMAPTIRVCVEAMDRANVAHMRRAKADEIVVRGKYTGFFLVNAVTSPGLGRAVDELLSFDVGNLIRRVPIPTDLVGRSFADVAAWFRDQNNMILIGLVSEAPGVDITAILAGDMSDLDLFIKRKFEEAGEDLSQAARREDVVINPPPNHPIDKWDAAIVVSAWARKRLTGDLS